MSMFITIAMLIEPLVMPAAVASLLITVYLAGPGSISMFMTIAMMTEPWVMPVAMAVPTLTVHLGVPGGYVNVYSTF